MKTYVHRGNPWLYEKDGSLNPAWVFLGCLLAVVCFAVIAAFLQSSITVKVVALSLVGTTINIFAICAVAQNRAAILANATSTGQIAKGLTGSVLEAKSDSMIEHEDRP